MRRFLLLTVVLVPVLAVASAADGRLDRFATADTESLSLHDGDGKALVVARGAILGRLDRGRLVVTDRPRGPETEIAVSGEEVSRQIDEQTTEYVGTDLRFRVFAGAWTVRIEGEGIDASAVVNGFVALEGAGAFSIGDGPYRRWPAELTFFRLGD